MERATLRGLFAPVLTPFDAALAPDAGRWLAHCRWLLGQGAGLAVFGTTSEANSLALAERERLLDGLIAAGIPPDRVVPGTGACALPDAIALTRRAVDLGCAGVLMLPPFYYKGLPDDGLFDYYARVIDAVASPRLHILLYHIPAVSGVPIGPALIERLLRRFPGTVAGIKDSAGHWADTEAMIRRFPGFAVFPGSELALVRALRAGAVGCISATANVQPAPIAAVVADPEGPEAEARQTRLDAVRAAVQRRPLIPALKAVLAAATGDPGWALVRPPFTPLPQGDAAALLRELAELDFVLPGSSTRPGLAQGQGTASPRMPTGG